VTPEREAHLFRIKAAFLAEVDKKYREGQREHGGDLFDHTQLWLVEQAMAEALDLYVYLFTLRERIRGLNTCPDLEERRDDCHCHCGKRYRYRWDETSPTGKTLEEARNADR
jgi:hypothetical protein